MREDEKEIYVYTVLGYTKAELIRMVAEFEYQEGKSPNAILISSATLYKLHKIGVKLKKLEFGRGKRSPVKLTVIPLDAAEEQRTVLCEVDPWDPRWEHLFFS